MSDDNILKEFLIAIGFKIDEAKLKKAQAGLKKVEKAAEAVGIAVGVAVAAVKVGVEQMEENLEGLYFASQRLGDGVAKIKAFSFAISQMGGSGKNAMQSLENLAEAIRSNPSIEGLLNGMGVKTREGNGELRGRVEIMRDAAKQLQKMDYRVAKQRAALLGIDTETLQAIRRGDLEKFMAQYERMAKNQDMDEAAKGAHDFMNNMRELGASFEMVWMVVATRWAPIIKVVTNLLKWLGDKLLWLDKVTDGWTTIMLSGAAVLASVAAAIGLLGGGLGGIGAAIAVAFGPITLIVALVGTMVFLAYELITRWKEVAASLKWAWGQIGDAAEEGARRVLRAIADMKRGNFGKAAHDLITAAAPTPNDSVPGQEAPRPLRSKSQDDLLKDKADLTRKLEKGAWGSAEAKARTTADYAQRLMAIDAELLARHRAQQPAASGSPAPTPPAGPGVQAGAQPSVATRVGQAVYNAAQLARQKWGIPASIVLGQWALESGKGARMPAGSNNPFGIKARAGEAAVQAWTTEFVRGQKVRVLERFRKFANLAEAFEAHAKLLATAPIYAKARQFLNDPSRFADALQGTYATDPKYAEKLKNAMRNGGYFAADIVSPRAAMARAGVQMTQTTTITVQGGEAGATGRAVAREQGRVNGDLVRSLKGVAA